jgi:PilZ domain
VKQVELDSPSLNEGDRVVVVPQPPGAAPRLAECRLVHVDEATGRLIVTPAEADTPLSASEDAALLVLVIRPGEPVLARPCEVEARLEGARWLLLLPTGDWRRIERRVVERAVVSLPARGHRYFSGGGAIEVRGRVRDISMTGFAFEGEAVALGELLVLEISLPTGEVIRVRGQAVRIVRPQVNASGLWLAGCQFWGLSPDAQERIARLVEPPTA